MKKKIVNTIGKHVSQGIGTQPHREAESLGMVLACEVLAKAVIAAKQQTEEVQTIAAKQQTEEEEEDL